MGLVVQAAVTKRCLGAGLTMDGGISLAANGEDAMTGRMAQTCHEELARDAGDGQML